MSIQNSLKRWWSNRKTGGTSEIAGFNTGFWFVLPVLLLMSAVVLYPVIRTVLLSLQPSGTPSVLSLNNYSQIFQAPWFRETTINTVIWIVVGGTLQIAIGFGVALLLNTKLPFRRGIRGMLLLPWVTPGIVIAITFSWMYDPQFGLINHLLQQMGLIQSPIAWLANPDLALPAVIVAGLWKRFPFVMMLILAGLQDVDESLTNAALLDGAPYHARLRHVTLPQLIPVLKIVVLLTFIWTFRNFAIVYTMTGGGPSNATNILPVQVYNLAFTQLQYGIASALSVLMLLIMVLFMFFYIRALRSQGVEL